MTQKKENATSIPAEESTQVQQQQLAQYHQLAQNLHSSSNQAEAEEQLKVINSLAEADQVALLKALSKERDSDAADVVVALNELSPLKSIRKEARRSLIRLEEAKIYPGWKPPVAQTPVLQFVANPPRFWKGYVTVAREEGEIQLVLCWEQGYEYSEIRMMIFLLDFWEQGLKEYILENTNRRNVDAQIQGIRSRLPDITLADCTLAEGRRLIEEALAVNKWRGTTPHKEYRHHLPTIKQLILDAKDVGEDRGLTFINPRLEADEVVGTFVAGWALGDYGLNYDMLTRGSSLRAGLDRDEWIERRHAWANEAKPTRFELGFIREREASAPALWLPSSISKNASTRKEVEIGWSLELNDTPLSGTLPEMPLGTVVYKETGRHWFWTSYTLVQEDGVWRIQQMSDEGAKAQGLPIAELQKRLKEYDQRLTELLQLQQNASQEETQEVIWRLIHTLHYDDALIVQLPLDRNVNGDAYNRAIGLGLLERAIAYLQRVAHNFAEQRGDVLRQLGITQESLAEYYREHGLNERAQHFAHLAETTLREALAAEDSIAVHAVLAELLMRRGGKLDEAEEHLNIAKGMATNPTEVAPIEADLGAIAAERNQPELALQRYQQVAEIDPNYEGVWFKIGLIQRTLNHLEEARAAYERAIEMQPRILMPYAELTTIYMDQGKHADAREMLERGLRSNPKSAPLLALLSSVYLETGDLRRAQAVLEEAEQANPRLEIVQAVREELDRRKKK